MKNIFAKLRPFIVILASVAFLNTAQAQVASPDKQLLKASSKSTPELSLVTKNKANSTDKKAPRVVLNLHKPKLEVFNHTLRILVKCDKNEFLLTGKVEDKVSGVASVIVDGKRVNVDAYGSFQTRIRLTQKYNVISIIANDHSGNQVIKELAIKTTTPAAKVATHANTNNSEPNAAERWVK
ncbi:hypothetical protein [Microscilla marina]|uniref:Uncharacterized protein n=1 Tax=Microscilla marina ATCC 23134 TaxID=313606 RepID=A1ZQY6_MICM2|nr:hypothetical protein [Microscilla marina]EAY27291.1 hypothetical protein M23134_06601 [Microscilla marina ATCC 23134]